MYESPTQTTPVLDCKGIETVRRDQCPAVSKTMDHTLRLLFNTLDLSAVKEYLQRQWYKILRGRVPLSDFTFAKEVKKGTYLSANPPLSAVVAGKREKLDKRDVPPRGMRVPYVVVKGEPGARRMDLVVHPDDIMHPDVKNRRTQVLLQPCTKYVR